MIVLAVKFVLIVEDLEQPKYGVPLFAHFRTDIRCAVSHFNELIYHHSLLSGGMNTDPYAAYGDQLLPLSV